VLSAPGVSRGFIRLVEGPEDDQTGTFHKRGMFNAELLTRDVETLFTRLTGSSRFRVVSELNTYDLSGAGGGAVSRSFATRGPGGAGFFFTQYLKVPPPRTLPVCETLVGPMFNAAISIDQQSRVETFYEKTLGMHLRLKGRLTQPAVNRIIGLRDEWGFMMLVYKGEGDGLIEVDVHEHDVPLDPRVPEDQLRPGNSMLTVETTDLDAVLRRAAEAGFSGTNAAAIAAFPCEGRRAAVLRGPAGERIELVESRPLTSSSRDPR
jgi:catechol 2,3-dioxygenase-like lactoylglutathione lyase family enzyme